MSRQSERSPRDKALVDLFKKRHRCAKLHVFYFITPPPSFAFIGDRTALLNELDNFLLVLRGLQFVCFFLGFFTYGYGSYPVLRKVELTLKQR